MSKKAWLLHCHTTLVFSSRVSLGCCGEHNICVCVCVCVCVRVRVCSVSTVLMTKYYEGCRRGTISGFWSPRLQLRLNSFWCFYILSSRSFFLVVFDVTISRSGSLSSARANLASRHFFFSWNDSAFRSTCCFGWARFLWEEGYVLRELAVSTVLEYLTFHANLLAALLWNHACFVLFLNLRPGVHSSFIRQMWSAQT